MIRMVAFDLDDTLFPEREFVRSGFRAASEWFCQTTGQPGLFAEAWRLFEQGQRGNVFDSALEALGEPVDASTIADLVRVYREHMPCIALFADAELLLESLQGTCRVGLITDGPATTQRNKVAALRLDCFLDAIVFSDELGRECWKPAAEPYQCLAVRLGVASGPACVYVGDNPHKDFVTARRLGWHTVRVRRPGTEHFLVTAAPDHEAACCVSTLGELREIWGLPGGQPPA